MRLKVNNPSTLQQVQGHPEQSRGATKLRANPTNHLANLKTIWERLLHESKIYLGHRIILVRNLSQVRWARSEHSKK